MSACAFPRNLPQVRILLSIHNIFIVVHMILAYFFITNQYGTKWGTLSAGGFPFGLVLPSIIANVGLGTYVEVGEDTFLKEYWWQHGNDHKKHFFVRILVGFLVCFIAFWSAGCVTRFFGLLWNRLSTVFTFVSLLALVIAGIRKPVPLYTAWAITTIVCNFIFGIVFPMLVWTFMLDSDNESWTFLLCTSSLLCIVLQVSILVSFKQWRKFYSHQQNLEDEGSFGHTPWELRRKLHLEQGGGVYLHEALHLGPRFALAFYILLGLGALALAFIYLWGTWQIPHDDMAKNLSGCETMADNCHCVEINGTVRTKDVTYGNANGTLLNLTVYYSTWNTTAKLPAALLVHGGGFRFGDRTGKADSEKQPKYELIKEEAQHYARHGFVAFAIDYRVEPEMIALPKPSAVRNAIHDAKAAVRYIVSHSDEHGVDASRIFGFGDSAGAITVTTMNYLSSEGESGNANFSSNLSAVISIAGALWPAVQKGSEFRNQMRHGNITPWYSLVVDSDIVVPSILSQLTFSVFRRWYENEESKWALQYITSGWFGWHVQWNDEVRNSQRPQMMSFIIKALRLEDQSCQQQPLAGNFVANV